MPVARPLKVCLVAASLDTGGMERVVYDLVKGLRQAGHEPFLFCTDRQGALFDDAPAIAKMTTNRQPTPWIVDLRVLSALKKFIRQYSIDVIHAHNQPAQLYAALAGRWTKRPVIVTIHGVGFQESPRAIRLRRWLTRFTDRLIAVSKDTRQSMVDKRIATADRLVVIPNGVDIALFSPAAISTPSELIPPDAVVIGSVGRLATEKNYPLLVRAFARLKEINPHVFLLLVGDGADRPRIEQEIDACGIRANCLITGIQKDVVGWLRRMQVFCLSSDTEGMPITLLEAGACGLPAVLTDVGGNHEVIENGITGLLVPPRDEARLADALQQLAGNTGLRKQMGDAARQRIEQRHSLEEMVRQHIAIYQAALA